MAKHQMTLYIIKNTSHKPNDYINAFLEILCVRSKIEQINHINLQHLLLSAQIKELAPEVRNVNNK